MQPNDLLTVGTFTQWMQVLHAHLQAQQPAAPATVLYSVGGLAEALGVHVDTVRAWLKKGKRGKDGGTVKLQAYHFTSEPRIPWAALLAYERGETIDLDALPAPVPAPTPPAAPAEAVPILRIA